jgi:DNA mismatch repair protein MutS2
VIALLETLRLAEVVARESAPVAGERALRLLGWDRVGAQIAAHCVNARAAAEVRATRPFADPEIIDLLRALADELRPAGETGRWPPVADVEPGVAQLSRPSPRRLEGLDLVEVATLADDLDSVRDHLLRGRAQLPTWAAAAQEADPFDDLRHELRRCLDRDGRLLDGASPMLARLRRAAANQEQVVRRAVREAMDGARARGWLTGDEVTLRGDRYCLPMRSGDRRRVDGIVHDRSDTGATIFVEPAGVVHLANEWQELRLEVGAEESRILLALNRRVDDVAEALLESCELLLLVDRVRAGMFWSRQRRAARPQLAAGAPLRVVRGRHPLLEAALAGRGEVVPLDLELPEHVRALVISGANAGGKSVAMKTVGVLVLLAQSGWDVPAREDTRLPLVSTLFVDLGDEQSIEESLSSFSAHLTHLRRFLAEADARSLVICDEIGTGTDPQEGTALAFTALEALAARGALVLASTHYGLLKAAVNDHPAMLNAAMDYDETSLQPLFSLRLGDPGASHAFDIARRVGLDPALLDAARARVGEDRVQIETLLADLGLRVRRLAADQHDVNMHLANLHEKETELTGRLKDLDRERKRELEKVRREGEALLLEARKEIEALVREVRSSQGDKVVIRKARDRVDDIARKLPTAPATPANVVAGPPQPGDRVRVPHLGLNGRVVEVRGGQVTVLADGLRLSVSEATVERIPGETAADNAGPAAVSQATGTTTGGSWAWQGDQPDVAPELDLRGFRAEEAWESVDKLLDRALPVGLTKVTLIHGLGTGRLREVLLERLASDPRVARTEMTGEGGRLNPGATNVFLV